MKYFTPELYVRGQSQDDKVLDEVEQQWEEAGERYVAYLESVADALPPGIRHIHDNYYLHDSVILSMGQQGDTFVIVLQLDAPPHDRLSDLLLFTYELTGSPVIERDVLPPELCCPVHVQWMYDEVERASGEVPGWVQSILLSNGWEVHLPFRDVHVRQLQPLIPPPQDANRAAALSQPA